MADARGNQGVLAVLVPHRAAGTSPPSHPRRGGECGSRRGGDGTLRPNSGWEAGSTNSDVVRIVDGVFAPESQQWNNGSFWWDETQTVSPYYTTVVLNGSYAFDRVVLQADNNDNYLVEYFDGVSEQGA